MSLERDTSDLAEPAQVAPNPTLWRMYQPLIWLFAATSAIGWAPLLEPVDWLVVATLIVVANLADLMAVQIREGMRVSTNHFAVPFALVTTGVAGAIVVALFINAGRLVFNRRDWNTFDVAVNISSASFAGMLWLGLHNDAVSSWGTGFVGAFVVVMIFALFRALINYGWTLQARSQGIPIPAVSAKIGKLQIAAATMFAPSITVFMEAWDKSQWATAALAIVLPFAATQYMVRAFGRERELNGELEDANVSLTEALVNALDARDNYSAGHSVAVAVYARDIAIEAGLDPLRVQRIYLSGLLHDIGKIAVPDAVLLKPGALTDEEFEEIKKHPVVGEEILKPSSHLQDVLPGVRHHHERMDGRGYPDGLAEDKIPLEARIIAVADAYNAMTSSRPYRDAMEPELAIKILVQNQGVQHDPFLVAAFQRVLASRHHDYAVAVGADFMTSQVMHELVYGAEGTEGIKSESLPGTLRLVDSPADDADAEAA